MALGSGGHREINVSSDLRWAASRVLPGGIIVLNDVLNAKWTGVTRATRSFFHLVDRRYRQLRPLLATSKKLYLTTPSHHRVYLRAICKLHRGSAGTGDDRLSFAHRLLPRLPRTIPLKVVRLPISAFGHALTAVEPSWNGTALFARDVAAQRLL